MQDFMLDAKLMNVHPALTKEKKEIRRLIQVRENKGKDARHCFEEIYNSRCLAYLDNHMHDIPQASAEIQDLHRKRLDE